METTTSFDLNRAIENWRANLAQLPAFRSDNLYELETHLRDSIATLEQQGLSAEEAFLVSRKRIGQAGALEAEFAKQNTRSVWLDRALWVLIGAQLWLLAGQLSRYLGIVVHLFVEQLGAWAITYGLGKFPTATASSVALVSVFPLTLLLGVAIFLQIHRWAKRRGWDFSGWLLQRPAWLAGAIAVIVLLPTILNPLVFKLVSIASIEHVYRQGYTVSAMVISLVVNTILLVGVVYVVAQRRLRLRKS